MRTERDAGRPNVKRVIEGSSLGVRTVACDLRSPRSRKVIPAECARDQEPGGPEGPSRPESKKTALADRPSRPESKRTALADRPSRPESKRPALADRPSRPESKRPALADRPLPFCPDGT